MTSDIRAQVAKYYDCQPMAFDDIPFYKKQIPSPNCSILELGCGTGRVLLPLVGSCGYIHGIDHSAEMLSICHTKLENAKIPFQKANVELGDISDFDLGRKFDLIIAPFRVMQNLDADEEVEGMFQCIKKHLKPGGTCILNVFKPLSDPDTLRATWCRQTEMFNWEFKTETGRITSHDIRPRMDLERMVIYPELIYRLYEGEKLVDEAVLKIAMRCYYPDQFIQLIESHEFTMTGRWGGYSGETYGEGSELVVRFTNK